MENCWICSIKKNKNYTFWENDLLFAAFDNYPVSPGHTLLSTKRHIADFKNLTCKEWGNIYFSLQEIIQYLEKTNLTLIYEQFIKEYESNQSVWFCKKALTHPRINKKPDGYNHGFNDGKAAGRTVDHFHWHIIPRFENDDTKTSQGGLRFVIPEMGDYFIPRP